MGDALLLVARLGRPRGDPIDLVVQISLRAGRVTTGVMDEKLSTGDDAHAIRVATRSPNRTIVEFVGGDTLTSRSQTMRLLARVEQFRIVVFDFSGVSWIGRAFADEIFRVFAHAHPGIQLQFIHARAAIGPMLMRARSSEARPLRKEPAPAGSQRRRPRR